MDLKSNHSSPVLTDPAPLSKSRLGLPSNMSPYSPTASPYSSSGLYLTIPKRINGKLEDVRVNGWLDAMIASSPPRKKLSKDIISESQTEDHDTAYQTWMKSYPSALNSFHQIASYAKCKTVALFLDYDGTLSPIVENPDHAFMSSAMRAAVKEAANYFPTAIISGRSRDKVHEFVRLSELYYAGSHGMDIMGPVRLSNSIDVHPDCIKTIDSQVLEVRPVIDWNKGKAAEFLLESLGLSQRDDVLPIYVGDDQTDEDAFKVLRESNCGFGILVSNVPKETTNAFYSLRDPSEVQEFLKSLVRWKKSTNSITN